MPKMREQNMDRFSLNEALERASESHNSDVEVTESYRTQLRQAVETVWQIERFLERVKATIQVRQLQTRGQSTLTSLNTALDNCETIFNALQRALEASHRAPGADKFCAEYFTNSGVLVNVYHDDLDLVRSTIEALQDLDERELSDE